MAIPFRAILFDLDETLHDRRATFRAYMRGLVRDFAPRLGPCDPDARMGEWEREDAGGYRPRKEFFLYLAGSLPWLSRPGPAELAEHYDHRFANQAVGMPGYRDCLGTLKGLGLGLGIVTNGTARRQRAKVERLGLGAWADVIVVSEEAGVAKPDPAIYRLALEGLGAAPESTLFVGDHPVKDMAGARAAGLATAWMRGSSEWPEGLARADRELDGLPGLAAWLAAMARG